MKIKQDKFLAVTQYRLSSFFETLAGLSIFSLRFFKEVFLPPYEVAEIRKHMIELGMKTLPIVGVTGFIIGLVMTMQLQPVLQRFGAEAFLPGSIGITIVRELGPVITALIFAGRVSSGIGAELGSMRVTEQIDAMEVSGVYPMKYLVVTRVAATTFMLPVLVIYADFLALIGSYIGYTFHNNISLWLFIREAFDELYFTDLIPATIKTFIFGFFIGILSCYKGYTTNRGAEGVGLATNSAVILSSLSIFIIDLIAVQITQIIL